MKKYAMILEVTSASDPNEWDWGAMLDLPQGEHYTVYEVEIGGGQ